MFNEQLVEQAILTGDKKTLGESFVALSRWVVDKQVRTPAWIDRRDIVQVGVEFCLKALEKKDPGQPRMRYFTQVVKHSTRRAVNRMCRTAGNSDGIGDLGVECVDVADSIQDIILRTRSAEVFPEIAREFVNQFSQGYAETVRDFMASGVGIVYRAEAQEFFRQLRRELQNAEAV